MHITYVGKNIELTKALKEIAADKVDKLSKLFPEEAEMRISFSAKKQHHKCEITIFSNKDVFRSETTSDDMYNSIDTAVQKMQRQLRKNKTALLAKRTQNINWDILNGKNEVEDTTSSSVARIKYFDPKPMNVEEAILQMQLTQHDFYAFRNADTDEFNVVYARKQDGYGLLCPE